jgi:hypothetical protein
MEWEWTTFTRAVGVQYFIFHLLLYFHTSNIRYRHHWMWNLSNGIYNTARHNHYTFHINIDTYNVSGSGRCLYHWYAL